MKVMNVQYNVGKVKYLVNYHDGKKTHKDGSPFFDVATFKNRRMFDLFQKELQRDGYNYGFSKDAAI